MSKPERQRIIVMVEGGKIVASDAWAQETIDKLPKGRFVIEPDLEEPTDALRGWFMAGIHVLYENVDGTGPGKTWPTETSLRKFILKEIGFAEAVIRVDGVKWIPLSMARGEMDYGDLATCLELSRAFCLDRWGFDPFATWSEAKDLEKHRQ